MSKNYVKHIKVILPIKCKHDWEKIAYNKNIFMGLFYESIGEKLVCKKCGWIRQ